MAYSKCPKCESYTFEMCPNEPKGSNIVIYFIQCEACGTVVGVTDDSVTLVKKLIEHIQLE